MSLPEVGDWAYVERSCGCSGSSEYLGLVVRVTDVYCIWGDCLYCGRVFGWTEAASTDDWTFQRVWLRRLPPLSTTERIPEREEA